MPAPWGGAYLNQCERQPYLMNPATNRPRVTMKRIGLPASNRTIPIDSKVANTTNSKSAAKNFIALIIGANPGSCKHPVNG